MTEFDNLLTIVRRKAVFDKSYSWFEGSQTYLAGLREEIDEVVEEIPNKRVCFLEDELADVLWDYLNFVVALEEEEGVNIEDIVHRACHKYHERLSAMDKGESWNDVKVRQKTALEKEQQHYDERHHNASQVVKD